MPDKEILAAMILAKLVTIKRRMYNIVDDKWIGDMGPGTGSISAHQFVEEMNEVLNMVDGYDKA